MPSERKRAADASGVRKRLPAQAFLVARAPCSVSPLRALLPVASIVAMNSIGSYVSARGAGLACPDWPLCPLPGEELVLLEFTHRAFAIVVLLAIIAVTVPSIRAGGVRRKLAVVGLALLLVQIGMGGAVVLTALRAELVAVHMALASSVLATYSMLAAVIVWERRS
jgi:cytochrome c oxidase assembly protein subunit 15